MMLQLNPSVPLDTPKGRGEAIIVIDYSPEFDLMWTVIIDKTCEVWTFKNSDVRGVPNSTLGRNPLTTVPKLEGVKS